MEFTKIENVNKTMFLRNKNCWKTNKLPWRTLYILGTQDEDMPADIISKIIRNLLKVLHRITLFSYCKAIAMHTLQFK